MKFLLSAVMAATLLSPGAQAAQTSFQVLRDQVYRDRLSTPPKHDPSIVTALAGAALGFGALTDRARQTLQDPTDTKQQVEPKILHPMGVCSEADWVITGQSVATGLLAQGTHVRAIVRMSAATSDVEYAAPNGPTRKFGLAIKLFPTELESTPVTTVNLFTLDQASLEGSYRASYISPDQPGEALYFVNEAPAKGFVAQKLTDVLGNIKIFGNTKEWRPDHRPLYPLTEVSANGVAVLQPVTPETIRFVPHVNGKLNGFTRDFRTELVHAQAGQISFDILIPGQAGISPKDQVVGTLTLGEPVMSDFCDQALHFHHHPNNRTIAN